MSVYRAPSAVATAEIRTKGSRFRAMISAARDESGALALLEQTRRTDLGATHHCWAWRLGADGRERSSDDGEPAGTAGRPILDVLRGAHLSDVVAVVSRRYGGIKLGKGGLARAYAGAVKEALDSLDTEVRRPTVELRVELPYDRFGALKRLVHPPEVVISGQEYGSTVRLALTVRADRQAAVEEALAELGVAREPGSE